MSGVYSRVTVVGRRRRIDVVLPADEAVGTLTGDLVRMLDEPPDEPPRGRFLVTHQGDVLGGDATLGAAGIADGAMLRLVGEEGIPPAPVVYDVAEETAGDRDARSWLFTTSARRVTGAVALAVLAAVAVPLLQRQPAVGSIAIPLLAAALLVVGIVLGRLATVGSATPRPVAYALVSAGVVVLGVHVATGALIPDLVGWQRAAGTAVVLALAPLAYAAAGHPVRGTLLGSTVAVVLAVAWTVGAAFGLAPDRLAAVLGVVVVALLGFLPRMAVLASGVAALDDRRTGGHDVARRDVHAALAAAHEGLVLACVAAAVSTALSGYLLGQHLTPWSVPLGVLLAFVLVSRSRVLPLLLEVVSLVGAAAVTAVTFVTSWAPLGGGAVAGTLGVVAVLGVVALLAVGVTPSDHGRARLRLILDRVEVLAVVAMIPLVVGIFGTYSRLLHMF